MKVYKGKFGKKVNESIKIPKTLTAFVRGD